MVVVVAGQVVDAGPVGTRSPFVSHSLCLWVVVCGRLVCLLSVGKPQNYNRTVDMGQLRQTRPDVRGKTTFVKTTGTNRERPTIFEAYLTVHQRNYSLQTVHWQRLGRLPTTHNGFVTFPQNNIPLDLRCYTDSDWAGDKTTRRSTSGWLCSLTWYTFELR